MLINDCSGSNRVGLGPQGLGPRWPEDFEFPQKGKFTSSISDDPFFIIFLLGGGVIFCKGVGPAVPFMLYFALVLRNPRNFWAGSGGHNAFHCPGAIHQDFCTPQMLEMFGFPTVVGGPGGFQKFRDATRKKSTGFRPERAWWCRVMIKKLKKFTTITFTTIKVWLYLFCLFSTVRLAFFALDDLIVGDPFMCMLGLRSSLILSQL